MRSFSVLSLAAAAVVFSFTAASANGTTRIETRPFYGAVVTIEEGVRVFRPLPSTERVIINPQGDTPLSLGFNETNVTERNYNYNYSETKVDGADGGSYAGGIYGGYGWGRNGGRRGGGHAVGRGYTGGGHGGHGGGRH